jgi:prepilin peptidase CpaA
MSSFILAGLFLVVLVAAAVSDLRSRRIPNVLTAGAFFLALTVRAFTGWDGIAEGLLGASLALAVMLPLFSMRGVGGGDAKLLIMTGAFLGPRAFLVALLCTALAGGVMSVIAAMRSGVILPVLFNTGSLLKWVFTLGRCGERMTLASPGAVSVPYGVAIAIGSTLALYMGGGIS